MQPSYLICKHCYTIVPRDAVPEYTIKHYPCDDEVEFTFFKMAVRSTLYRCSKCGSHHFVRKVASKL